MPPPDTHARTARLAEASARLVLRGIALNALLAVLKFAGGFFGHTYALIADGAESLLDILSSLLVWAGFKVAAQPPDEDHPYGHGKAEPIAALGVALFIFGMAGWVGWHAIHEIITPHRGPAWWTLVLLAGVIVAKAIFSRRMGEAGERYGSTALGVEAMHHWSDALTSAAAFVGIAIALAGGKGWETADDWAALFACVIISFNGVQMLNKALGDVMDSAVPQKFDEMAHVVGLGPNNGRAFVGWLRDLKQQIGITGGLAQRGVTEAMLPQLVPLAAADFTGGTNPRPATAADYERFFRQAL